MKLTGAAMLVSRGMKVFQAAPAAYPYRSAALGRAWDATGNSVLARGRGALLRDLRVPKGRPRRRPGRPGRAYRGGPRAPAALLPGVRRWPGSDRTRQAVWDGRPRRGQGSHVARAAVPSLPIRRHTLPLSARVHVRG